MSQQNQNAAVVKGLRKQGFSISVECGKDFVRFDYYSGIIQDYEEEQIATIPFNDPQFIMMIYSSEKMLKSIVENHSFPQDIFIDDDDFKLQTVSEFKKTLCKF